jgi:hypothetical protein
MSKFTWNILALLFCATTAISQWHLSVERQMHAQEIEGWAYITEALCDRIDERDEAIEFLIEFIEENLDTPTPAPEAIL